MRGRRRSSRCAGTTTAIREESSMVERTISGSRAGWPGRSSQSLSASEPAEVAIEGAHRNVAGGPRDLQNQAIREAQSRLLAKMYQCCPHHVRLGNGQGFVAE